MSRDRQQYAQPATGKKKKRRKIAALAVASNRVARQTHALSYAEHGISQPGHRRSHGTVSFSLGEPRRSHEHGGTITEAETARKETTCAQMTHRIIPTGGSHGSTSSQATGPSRGQGSRYRNNPGIGVIPVRPLRVRVTQPGGQLRQPGLHVGALAIPADEGVHGERVPEPVDSRPAAVRAGPDPGPAQEDLEHLLRGLVVQAVAGGVDEQGRLTRRR